jgi:hypothetical protein
VGVLQLPLNLAGSRGDRQWLDPRLRVLHRRLLKRSILGLLNKESVQLLELILLLQQFFLLQLLLQTLSLFFPLSLHLLPFFLLLERLLTFLFLL